jgi:hypothetical protein
MFLRQHTVACASDPGPHPVPARVTESVLGLRLRTSMVAVLMGVLGGLGVWVPSPASAAETTLCTGVQRVQ